MSDDIDIEEAIETCGQVLVGCARVIDCLCQFPELITAGLDILSRCFENQTENDTNNAYVNMNMTNPHRMWQAPANEYAPQPRRQDPRRAEAKTAAFPTPSMGYGGR